MQRLSSILVLLVLVFTTGCRRAEGPRSAASEDSSSSERRAGEQFAPGTPPAESGPAGSRGVVAVPAGLLPDGLQTVSLPRTGRRTPPGLLDYLEGIEQLEATRWPEAAAAFGRAAEADGDNAPYHTARGVALTLAEQFPAALTELDRAMRLRPDDFDAKLWLAAAYRMGGDPARGARYFTTGKRETHDYASLVYNDMAMEYWSSKYQGQLFDRQTGRMVPTPQPVRRKFPEAGASFARRAKAVTAGQDLTQLLFDRARERYNRGEYAKALDDLEQVRALRPEDLDVLFFHASCKLGLGDAATARREFTRLLSSRTNLAAAYLGRAFATARLGDARRGRADLATAAALDPSEADRYRPRVEKILQSWDGTGAAAPPALFAAVEQAAREGAPWNDLVARAVVLHKTAGAARLHYDEAYQDRLKALEDAARKDPGEPARWVDLGKFLYDESEVFGEKVEPRGPARRYRYQTPQLQKQEVVRAEAALDQALKIEPNHLRALVAKAALCFDQARYGDAESLLRRALRIGPNDPEMLYLFSELRKYGASWRAYRANALRTPDVWSTQTREGDYIVTRTCTRNPTQADLRAAEEYERQSNQLYQLARENIERALRLSAGTAQGFYYQGLVHKWAGNFQAAEQDFRQALQLDPRFLRAHQELIYVLHRQGREDDRLRQEAVLMNVVETTAGPLLKLSWNKIGKTTWGAAGQALDESAKLDSADARIPAYRAVLASAQGQTEEAERHLRVALALEEARLKRQGTTLQAGGSGLLDPADGGLTMVLRNLLGQSLLQRGQANEALELHRANAALEARLSRRDWMTRVYSAMLPDPNGPPGQVPEAENVVALLAWSRLGMGNAQLALGWVEAAKEFEAVMAYRLRLLATEKGRERLNEPEAWAVFGLCRLDLARGDPQAAFERLLRWTNRGGLSAPARAELKKLESAIDSARRRGR
jgi:tetratricopeptide (TPR) repeat protein